MALHLITESNTLQDSIQTAPTEGIIITGGVGKAVLAPLTTGSTTTIELDRLATPLYIQEGLLFGANPTHTLVAIGGSIIQVNDTVANAVGELLHTDDFVLSTSNRTIISGSGKAKYTEFSNQADAQSFILNLDEISYPFRLDFNDTNSTVELLGDSFVSSGANASNPLIGNGTTDLGIFQGTLTLGGANDAAFDGIDSGQGTAILTVNKIVGTGDDAVTTSTSSTIALNQTDFSLIGKPANQGTGAALTAYTVTLTTIGGSYLIRR